MRLYLFGIIAQVYMATVLEASSSLPPRGKRLYLVDQLKLAQPTQIVDAITSTPQVPFLRDPIQPGAGVLPPKRVKAARAPSKPPGWIETGKLKFKSYSVAGALSRPRVEFSQEELRLGRSDEAFQLNIRQRIDTAADELRARTATLP